MKATAVLVAAREPLERLAPPADAPWPERVLCCRLGDVEIVNLHSPIAPDLDAGRPWSAVVLREQRPSPRDPRSGLTMLLARTAAIELRGA